MTNIHLHWGHVKTTCIVWTSAGSNNLPISITVVLDINYWKRIQRKVERDMCKMESNVARV